MGVKMSRQFNRPAVSLMNEAITASQILQVANGSQGIKLIQGIHCSSVEQSQVAPADAQTAISRSNIRVRVAVIAEDLDLSAFSEAQLLTGFNPIAPFIQFGDYRPSNILYDRTFVNFLVEDFSEPLVISEGNAVSVIMSQGLIMGDALLVSSVKLGFLNVRGEIVAGDARKFPFMLR